MFAVHNEFEKSAFFPPAALMRDGHTTSGSVHVCFAVIYNFEIIFCRLANGNMYVISIHIVIPCVVRGIIYIFVYVACNSIAWIFLIFMMCFHAFFFTLMEVDKFQIL